MKAIFTAIGLLAATSAAMAQDPPPPLAASPAPADPARLAAAERAVAALVPNGVYMRMMRDQMPKMMDAMMAQMSGMTARDMGLPDKSGKGETLAQAARQKDPAFEERMRITTRVMFDEFGRVFGAMEPRIRAGLSRAFARKFSKAQLDDMNAFFATPSGRAFASEYLLTFTDPEMMREMMGMMPEMMKAMPAIMEKAQKATAHLPPPPKPNADE